MQTYNIFEVVTGNIKYITFFHNLPNTGLEYYHSYLCECKGCPIVWGVVVHGVCKKPWVVLLTFPKQACSIRAQSNCEVSSKTTC